MAPQPALEGEVVMCVCARSSIGMFRSLQILLVSDCISAMCHLSILIGICDTAALPHIGSLSA